MSHHFSATDLAQLQHALRALLAPVDAPDGTAWPAAATTAVREAMGVGAEGHGHLYFVRGADPRPIILYSDYGPDLVEAYNAEGAPHDESSRRIQERRLEVAHPMLVMERAEFFESPIYRDFFRPYGVGSFVSLLVPGAHGPTARLSIASPALVDDARLQRVYAMMHVLLPAFRAGMNAWRLMGGPAGALPAFLDALGDGALVCDRTGTVRHESRALAAVLVGDPAGQRVRDAARALAVQAASLLRRGADPGALPPAERALSTPAGTYWLRAALVPEGAIGREPMAVVTVTRDEAATRPAAVTAGPTATPAMAAAPGNGAGDDRLRARFGLTAQEVTVARLLAERRTDAEVGAALGISANTARTHAERVRRKLGVRRRTDVAAALAPAGAPGVRARPTAP